MGGRVKSWCRVLPGQGQVVAVELQGFHVVMQVKVGVAQLTVDGTQHLQVLCAHLDGRLKEGHPRPVVPGFTEPLALQRQLQAGHLHPTAGNKSPKVWNQDGMKLESRRGAPEILLWVKAVWALAAKTLSEQKLWMENVVYLPLSLWKQWLPQQLLCYAWCRFLCACINVQQVL